jgi:hypothetical protein
MTHTPIDGIRQSVLDRMERGNRAVRNGMLGAAVIEAALLAFALLYINWKDKLQVEFLVFAVLGYSITAFGLVALAGHVTRSVGRILAVLDSAER